MYEIVKTAYNLEWSEYKFYH